VDRDNITIRHSIPMPASSPDSNDGVRPSTNRPSPILVQVIFCVQTVKTPVTMSPNQDAGFHFLESDSGLSNFRSACRSGGLRGRRSVSFERPIIPLRLNAKN